MFPTNLDQPYQSRARRRGRNDPNSRDYICPCGKSYLSYPALFTHIKIKHNGRAPGQIIKPRPENSSRRGRPRAREVYDSESNTDDIASNCMDRLCDFVMELEKKDGNLKEIYMKDQFYDIYVNYNPQEHQSKYDDTEDLYEETCETVFCQLLADINKKINEPYYFDILFLFFAMMMRAINTEYQQSVANDKLSAAHDKPSHGSQEQEYRLEDKENSQDEDPEDKKEYIRNIPKYINQLQIEYIPQFSKEMAVSGVPLFLPQNTLKLIHLFMNWLTMKKYLCYKIEINDKFEV